MNYKYALSIAALFTGLSGSASALDWEVWDAAGNYTRTWDNSLVFSGNGIAHAPYPSGSGFTVFNLTLPNTTQINGDNFMLEARVKDPGSEGGTPAYD